MTGERDRQTDRQKQTGRRINLDRQTGRQTDIKRTEHKEKKMIRGKEGGRKRESDRYKEETKNEGARGGETNME